MANSTVLVVWVHLYVHAYTFTCIQRKSIAATTPHLVDHQPPVMVRAGHLPPVMVVWCARMSGRQTDRHVWESGFILHASSWNTHYPLPLAPDNLLWHTPTTKGSQPQPNLAEQWDGAPNGATPVPWRQAGWVTWRQAGPVPCALCSPVPPQGGTQTQGDGWQGGPGSLLGGQEGGLGEGGWVKGGWGVEREGGKGG